MHVRLKEALITSARCGIRWGWEGGGGGAGGVGNGGQASSSLLRLEAIYCGFLLETGELSLLQQVGVWEGGEF